MISGTVAFPAPRTGDCPCSDPQNGGSRLKGFDDSAREGSTLMIQKLVKVTRAMTTIIPLFTMWHRTAGDRGDALMHLG